MYFRVLLLIFTVYHAAAVYSVRVGIIGAGIGGASTAYHLKKLFPDDIEISVYEQNDYIGGRLKHITIDGEAYELGGDAFSNTNEYVLQISQDLQMKYDDNSDYDGNGLEALWDGHNVFPIDTSVLEEGLFAYETELMRGHLWLNYEERGNSGTFETIEEFASYGKLDEYTSASSQDWAESSGLDEDFLFTMWTPLSRVIYDQNLQCNAFAGFVEGLSVITDAYTVYGGNDVLVQAMFDVSGADIYLNTPVVGVTGAANTYQITTADGNSYEFDFLVIAAPLEAANLTFTNLSISSLTMRDYHHWFVTYAVAQGLNSTYFVMPDPVPDTIFTTDNSTAPFTIVRPMGNTSEGYNVYKFFSNQDVSSILDDIFIDLHYSYVQYWPHTFPDLSPTTDYQPIMLDNRGLFNLNSIESLATAMEASTLSGRNIALLISKQYYQQ